MEYREFSAKNVDDAITEACESLMVTSDRLDYEIISNGSAGFLGIASKPAVIKARIKEEKASEYKPEVQKTLDSIINELEKEKKELSTQKYEIKKGQVNKPVSGQNVKVTLKDLQTSDVQKDNVVWK